MFDFPLILLIDVVDLRLKMFESIELLNILMLNGLPHFFVDGQLMPKMLSHFLDDVTFRVMEPVLRTDGDG